MKVLGVRTAPKQMRYALLQVDNNTVNFLNQSTENLIRVPANIEDIEEILHWYYSELQRVLRQNPDIDLVAVKTNEYARSDSKTSRLASYLDATVLLASQEANVPVRTRIYNQIGAKRSDVKERAQSRVGATPGMTYFSGHSPASQ